MGIVLENENVPYEAIFVKGLIEVLLDEFCWRLSDLL